MEKSLRDMTVGKPWKLIIKFAFPLMVGNAFQQLYVMVDTAVVGKKLGVLALAALGTCDLLCWLVTSTIQSITQGFSIIVAQRFGARDKDGMQKAMFNSLILSIATAVFMLILMQALVVPALGWLNTPDEVFGYAREYLRVFYAGIPISVAFNYLAAILRAMGDSKTPLYAMTIAAALNIVLDILFVFGFNMGVAGAAGATLIAQFVATLCCFIKVRKFQSIKIKKENKYFDRKLSAKLLAVACPMAGQIIVISIGGLVVQAVVNSCGVIFLAGYTATYKIYGLLEVAAKSYGYSISTYTSQNLGAGEIKRINKGYAVACLIGVLTSFVIAGIMLIFGRLIISCFMTQSGQGVEESMKVAVDYLKIMITFLPMLYIVHISESCVQGLGKTVLTMVVGFLELGARIFAALVLIKFMGSYALLYAEPIAWSFGSVLMICGYLLCMRFITKKQRNKQTSDF